MIIYIYRDICVPLFITHLIGSWLISFDLSIVLYLDNAWEVSTDFGLDQNL